MKAHGDRFFYKTSRNVQAIGSLSGMAHSKDHGIVRDEKGQEQPNDKKRAQQSGVQKQKDAAKQPESPGQPAGGE
jgi:hypothetical protein